MRTLLVTVGALGGAIWVGGMVVVALVAGTARGQLSPADRIEFFRAFGRRYLRLSGCALALAYVCAVPLLLRGEWSEGKSWIVATALALVVATATGVAQARRLGDLRQRALPAGVGRLEVGVRRAARAAVVLRTAIALITVALVVLVVAAVPR